jgi:RsiW-degrading membrane proteinase PrsW (M82 family)
VSAAGWRVNPWGVGWRWWNGAVWSIYTDSAPSRPKLPPWLSWPVVAVGPLFLALLALILLDRPAALLLALVPAASVLPFLLWLNRVQPEPLPARVHAFLWGAVVATSLASIVNEAAMFAGGEALALIGSAPLGEEALKGLAVVWAVRRGEVMRRLDAVVCALWAALGFTLVEDALYLSAAESSFEFWEVFISRSVVPPYVHLLFSAFVAAGVWRALERGRSVWAGLAWGVAVGAALHAVWNAAVFSESGPLMGFVWVASAALSAALLSVLARERARHEDRFYALMPHLMAHYGLGEGRFGMFRSAADMRAARRATPPRQRAGFDAAHNALVRLADAHFSHGSIPHDVADALLDEVIRHRPR